MPDNGRNESRHRMPGKRERRCRIKVWVGASLPAAPPVRIAKSRQFSMAQWTTEKAGIQCRGMDEMKAGIQCRGMDIRKGRDVDVRNANEMRTGLNNN